MKVNVSCDNITEFEIYYHENFYNNTYTIIMFLHNNVQFLDYTVSDKNTHLADFETCVFRGYLRNHLSYKKSCVQLFASFTKELSDEIRIFQIRSQNQLIFSKTMFCQKKVSYLKKSTILKNSQTIFSWI